MKIGLGWKIGIICCVWMIALGLRADTSVDSMLSEARTKTEQGDLEGAAQFYHRALQADNDNEEARQGLADAVVHGHIQDPQAEQADVLNGIIEDEIQKELPSTAIPLSFLKNGSLGPKDKSMSRPVLSILTHLQNGDNEAAISAAKKLQKRNPKHPVPYNLLGLAWQAKGDPSLARDFFKEALALKEDFHAARINLAELSSHLGEFGLAEEELEKVLKMEKKDRRASLALAQLLTVEGKLKQAEAWYNKTSQSF